jgi:hypothetical protein
VKESAQDAIRMETEDMEQYGHCLTDVRIAASSLAGAGNGLFAERDFQAGEVVTISPVLSLPRSVVDDSVSDSVLKNYCFASPDSDVILFPLNYGPMINHNTSGEANVQIDWYDWSPIVAAMDAKYHPAKGADSSSGEKKGASYSLNLADKLRMSAQELFSAPFAQLDLAYRAARPIARGEELFLDYGAHWHAAWAQYSSDMSLWEQGQAHALLQSSVESEKRGVKPAFRHYMSAPAELYPSHWISSANIISSSSRTEL